MKVLARSRRGETARNRKGKETLMSRRFKKVLGNQYWFWMGEQPGDEEVYSGEGLAPRSGRLQGRKDAHQDKRYVESVVLVPCTPEGNLRSRLNRVELMLNYRTRYKYIEELGSTIAQEVVRKDPTPVHC